MDAELEARIAELESKVNELSRLAATPGIIRATRIQIEDQDGEPLAVLGSGMRGGCLTLFRQGKPLIHLSADMKGGLVQVLDRDGESVVGLGSDRFGGLVSVSNAEGRPIAGLGVDGFGGVIQTLDGFGETTGTMRSDEDGGLIEARNKDGEVVASMAVVDDGGLMQIRNHDGGTVASLSSVSTGGRLALLDSLSRFILGLGGTESGGCIDLANPVSQEAKTICLSETGSIRVRGTDIPGDPHEPKTEPTAKLRKITARTRGLTPKGSAGVPTSQASIAEDPNHHETAGLLAEAVQRDLANIRDAPDIVEVISTSVELQADDREFTGNCPFHEDSEHCMCVIPLKQMYFCSGCGAGGSAITFVQEYHKLSREEAIAILAMRFP